MLRAPVILGHDAPVVDWGAGRYERTAQELEPAAREVIALAAPARHEELLDLACGTGNALLLAAGQVARAVGVDGARRLLGVARERAHGRGLQVELVEGDLLALPLLDASFDVVVSVFGVIFASDPAVALREIRRVVRPGGRVALSAWVPGGPVNRMLEAAGDIAARITSRRPPQPFPWFDAAAVGPLAQEAGLLLRETTSKRLEIRGTSPEAYVASGAEHPMAVAMAPMLAQAGAAEETREAMVAAISAENEDPDGFLIHSPYVIHELTLGPGGGDLAAGGPAGSRP